MIARLGERSRPGPVAVRSDQPLDAGDSLVSLGARRCLYAGTSSGASQVEGVLARLRPSLAIEIGSAEGACLRRIAAYAGEAHSFDLQPPSLEMPHNVTLHIGDSHELLAPVLAELSEQDRNVDLVIVDGDHSPEGVRQDLEELLDSRALTYSIILIHDVANERDRQAVDAVHFAAWPKVAHVELDWIPGQLFAEPALRNELWYGIGLVIVDSSRLAYMTGSVYEQRYHPAAPLLAQVRDLVVARERLPPGMQALQDEANALPKRLAELGVELAAARTREAELTAEMVTLQHRDPGSWLDGRRGSRLPGCPSRPAVMLAKGWAVNHRGHFLHSGRGRSRGGARCPIR